ncbi:NADH-ubiquinone oxidoreductase chain 5 [Trichuris trichiura]|uniref:NADH-ubiquinone oxidoreductase chain 5 n=1 Tax=Trichuris trichiura TaxID=36087 RepID=A0A077ZME9_TRITR|nr:NADH-ubiquinone oxidoreductase chain 5 [Trichuris trichiura]
MTILPLSDPYVNFPNKLILILLSTFIVHFSLRYATSDLPVHRFMVLIVIFTTRIVIINGNDSC